MNYTVMLESQKNSYSSNVGTLEAKLKQLKESYESLRVFKGVVERSGSDFNSANREYRKILTELDVVQKNSITVQRYQEGMNGIFNGVGNKIVLIAYAGLLSKISKKMNEYGESIKQCEEEISKNQKIISELDIKIQDEKRKQGEH